MSLSIIIPCKNESLNINNVNKILKKKITNIDYEIIFINDFSEDNTKNLLINLSKKDKRIKFFDNKKKGLGGAINLGISKVKNKYLVIMMADLSDDAKDLLKYYKIISQNKYDGVFGSRFTLESKIKNYPIIKYLLNRVFNNFIKIIFSINYNDMTNAFKCYNSKRAKSLMPLFSENFNIFLELPLRFIMNNSNVKFIPINFFNIKKGNSNFKIKELGSHYIYTLINLFFYKILIQKK
jgi:dolichol-phosphate mannosyltransferase